MRKVIVPGPGMVGSAMGIDTAKTHKVAVSDFDAETLIKSKKSCFE